MSPMSSDEPRASMVDVAFAVECESLSQEHRRALAAALEQALPWLATLPDAAVHRLNLSASASKQPLLSRRTRLTLRVPRARAQEAMALAGRSLQVGDSLLSLGAAHQRELLAHSTLYAHFVAAEDADEASFMRAAEAELAALGVPCRCICGRHQTSESDALQGFSLMLDGLSPQASLRVQESGLGLHRRLGCGVFVPHKSAVAVGA